MLDYFRPLLNQRLIDLDADQKQDRYLAGADPWCPWWESAEEREEAIQAKLKAQKPYFGAFGRYARVPQPLAHGIPDSERVYQHQGPPEPDAVARMSAAEVVRDSLDWAVGRCLAHLEPMPCPMCAAFIAAGL